MAWSVGSERLGTMKPAAGKHKRREEVLCPSSFLLVLPILAIDSANSSPSIHSLLTISLTTIPGHFQNDLNPQTKYLVIQVLLSQTEIQDKQDEVRFLKGKCCCIIIWKSRYLPMFSAFRIPSAWEFQLGHFNFATVLQFCFFKTDGYDF